MTRKVESVPAEFSVSSPDGEVWAKFACSSSPAEGTHTVDLEYCPLPNYWQISTAEVRPPESERNLVANWLDFTYVAANWGTASANQSSAIATGLGYNLSCTNKIIAEQAGLRIITANLTYPDVDRINAGLDEAFGANDTGFRVAEFPGLEFTPEDEIRSIVENNEVLLARDQPLQGHDTLVHIIGLIGIGGDFVNALRKQLAVHLSRRDSGKTLSAELPDPTQVFRGVADRIEGMTPALSEITMRRKRPGEISSVASVALSYFGLIWLSERDNEFLDLMGMNRENYEYHGQQVEKRLNRLSEAIAA